MRKLILYSTLGCHLCELAKEQLNPLLEPLSLSFQEKDIADEDMLMEAYGVKIPVLLCCASQRELCWPFDTAGIEQFLLKDY